MVQKKVNRIFNYTAISVRDSMINNILTSHHFDFGVTIYSIIASNPIEIAVSILSLKLGITNKVLIALIIGFLI